MLLSAPPLCSTHLFQPSSTAHRCRPTATEKKLLSLCRARSRTYPALLHVAACLLQIILYYHCRATQRRSCSTTSASLPFSAWFCLIKQYASTSSKLGRLSLIWETLSAFAAFRPTKNGGREVVLKAILFHTAVSRSQTLLITHSTLTIDTVALATASQGHFSAKLLTSYQGYFQITASHRDLCRSDNILHLSRTCLMRRCDGHTTPPSYQGTGLLNHPAHHLTATACKLTYQRLTTEQNRDLL